MSGSRTPLPRGAYLVAFATLALLLLTAGRYGFHRDELYFMEAGHHPAWGYDDQPPLTPLIARAAVVLFGNQPTGLRVPSAVAFAICVLLTALTAQELGAGRRGQLVAAVSLPVSALIFVGHLVSTTTYDLLCWTLLLYLLVRLLQRADPRLWLVVGLVLGVALENKWLSLTGVVAIAVAAVGTRERWGSRWLGGGLLIAFAIWLPNLIWQADHGWPQRVLADQIAYEDPLGARIKFLPFQLLIVSPFLAYVWFEGLRWLLRDRAASAVRVLGIAYVLHLALCLLSGAKEYYAIGWYPLLLAAGAVSLEPRLAIPRVRRRLGAALAASALLAWAIQLPVVPARSIHAYPLARVNRDALETVGWPQLADAVGVVVHTLSREERARAVIFTANYGEAGALRRYGPSRGLPLVYSGHNSFHSFGIPELHAAPVIVVGYDDRAYLSTTFVGCHRAARFYNGLGVDNEEQGTSIEICDAPRGGWGARWPHLHHLDA